MALYITRSRRDEVRIGRGLPSGFSYCHGGGGYLSYFLAERQEIKGRQSSLARSTRKASGTRLRKLWSVAYNALWVKIFKTRTDHKHYLIRFNRNPLLHRSLVLTSLVKNETTKPKVL